MKRPTDSTTNTTSGQTSTTIRQSSTTSGQTGATRSKGVLRVGEEYYE